MATDSPASRLKKLSKSRLVEENRRQADKIVALEQRIEALERRLALNSRNSGKPPSSDGLSKPPASKRTASLRGKSGRPSGGQPGHKGKTLRQVENPDEIIDHFCEFCPDCGHVLPEAACEGRVARQVFDLPPPPPVIVTEHRAHVYRCPRCNTTVCGKFPEGVSAPVQYGPGVAAMASYLQMQHCIPEDRLSHLFDDLFGLPVAAATLGRLVGKAAGRLLPFANAVRDVLCGPHVAVKHMDETGFRVAGKTRWLHVICSTALTHVRMGAGRGDMLCGVSGMAVHDGWASYARMEGVQHALCNAHHLRELQALAEIEKEDWAVTMTQILLDAKKAADSARENGRKAVAMDVIAGLVQRYDACIATALSFHESQPPLRPAARDGKKRRGRPKRRTGHNLALRLRDHRLEVLRFLTDTCVPFTNNEAERDLRMSKVRQKVSGCFRTMAGAQNYCTLRSVIGTGRKQGWPILETLKMSPDQLILKLSPA